MTKLDDSLYDAGRESWKPETVVHNSEERRYVAKVLFDQPSGTHGGSQTRPSNPYDQSHGCILLGTRNVKSEMINLQS
jgi:hypothetical protein